MRGSTKIVDFNGGPEARCTLMVNPYGSEGGPSPARKPLDPPATARVCFFIGCFTRRNLSMRLPALRPALLPDPRPAAMIAVLALFALQNRFAGSRVQYEH